MNKYLFSILVCSSIIYANTQKSVVVSVTDPTFESIITNAEKPVVVKFFATWCQPCKTMDPVFKSLAETHSEQYEFVAVNIDEAPETIRKYIIMSVPTFAVFQAGELCNSFSGMLTQSELEEKIKECLEHGATKKPMITAPQIPSEKSVS